MSIRFSMFQALEGVTGIGLAMAVPRILDTFHEGRGGFEEMAMLLTGAIIGACLGLRWFFADDVALCSLKTLAVASIATSFALMPFIVDESTSAWSRRIESHLDFVRFLRVFVALSLLGGILGSLMVLLPAALAKLVLRGRRERHQP